MSRHIKFLLQENYLNLATISNKDMKCSLRINSSYHDTSMAAVHSEGCFSFHSKVQQQFIHAFRKTSSEVSIAADSTLKSKF